MRKNIFFVVVALAVAILLSSVLVISNREKVDFSLVEELNFDKNFERAGLKEEREIFKKIEEYSFENVLSPTKIYVTDNLIFIYDASKSAVDSYDLMSKKLIRSYFRKGKAEGEILSGELSISHNKRHLLFNDIQQNRIVIVNLDDNNIKTVNVKYSPESSTIFKNKLYLRSFYLKRFVGELNDKGEVERELQITTGVDSMLNLGVQGKMTVGQDLLLISFNHATPIYGYSLFKDSVIFIADTPISIPIPKPYAEKSGKKTTYMADPKSVLTTLDLCLSEDYIFVLFSGGVPSEVKSLTDILFIENSKILNIFSRKTGKYICSSKIPVFARSIDVQENKLYAITNLNEQELTKVFVYDIDVKKIKEFSGE